MGEKKHNKNYYVRNLPCFYVCSVYRTICNTPKLRSKTLIRSRHKSGEDTLTGSLFQTLWELQKAVFAARQKMPNFMLVQHLRNLTAAYVNMF